MKTFRFALKRTLRSPSYILLLLLCCGAVLLASLPGAAGSPPPAGVCVTAEDPASLRVAEWLEEQGFVRFRRPDEMTAQIRQGTLNCGVILPADLEHRLQEGSMEAAVTFVSSPTSYAPQLSRNLTAAALFREYAPYLSAAVLPPDTVTEAELIQAYWDMSEAGLLFSFHILEQDGSPLSTDRGQESLMMGALSILMMTALLSSIPTAADSGFAGAALRLGTARAIRAVLLPGIGARLLPAAAAAFIALLGGHLVGGSSLSLLPAAIIHILTLTAAAMLLTALLPRRKHTVILLALLIIASLALCPLFGDPALLSPAAEAVRRILPSYWLWMIREQPLIWLLAACAALPVTAGCLILRLSAARGKDVTL